VIESNLENELKQVLSQQQEPAIILHADKTVDIEHVVKVMDIAYRNKYKIVLATKPN
jgi:biopolymer transport protein ExbD